MNAVVLMVATAVLGVDYGWHRLPNGEWEYIIQIEPALVETLSQGQSLVSQMPPELQGVRRFRIQVAEGEVKRDPLPNHPIAVGSSTLLGAPVDPGRGGFGTGGRANLGTGWPVGVDPQSLAGLRTFEWVSLQPIELNPLENELLRQWGGPDPVPRDERPWDRLSLPPPPMIPQGSQWPGLLPRPDDNHAALDREVGRFDLNEDEPASGDWHLGTTGPGAKRGTGTNRIPNRVGSQATQRGGLDVRDSARTAAASSNQNYATQTAEHTTRATDERTLGASHLNPARTTGGALTAEGVGAQVWWPLTMTVLLLFASFGGNLYLGWLALDFYRRYREAAWELRASDGRG